MGPKLLNRLQNNANRTEYRWSPLTVLFYHKVTLLCGTCTLYSHRDPAPPAYYWATRLMSLVLQ